MISESLITHNCRVKLYSDANGNYYPYEAFFSGKDVFRDEGWEVSERTQLFDPLACAADTRKRTPDDCACRSRSVSFARARNRCFDLLRCNIFPKKDACGLFVTLTLDEKRIDRYEYTEVVRQLGRWLDNRVRRRDLKYILVPEYHLDGAIHFHGVMNAAALDLSYSGKKQKGKKVYNIADYPFGFTNVKRITGANSNERVAKYIFKYLTKTNGVKVGGRYYLHGGKLAEPIIRRASLDYFSHKEQAERAFSTDFLGDCYIIRDESALAGIMSEFDSLGVSTE